MKLHFVRTVQLYNPNGIGYVDDSVSIPHQNTVDENVEMFIETVGTFITDDQSIILHREDLLRFVDTFVEESGFTRKRMVDKLRVRLRQEFDVCRIRFNPRTLALQDKSYIIHKRFFDN